MEEKIIETERLILRPWKVSDIPDMVEGLNNFETAKNLTTPFPYTAQNAMEYINRNLNNDGTKYAFAVQLKSTGKVIGGTTLELRQDPKVAGGGIWLNEAYTGKGYGTEVWSARAKFAFENGIEVLANGYFAFNSRSKKMQEKLGAKTVGEKENFCPALNKSVREILVELNEQNFKGKK